MVIRRILAAAFMLVAVAACLMLLGYRASIERTVSNGREIERQFRLGADVVRRFEAATHRRARPGEVNTLLEYAASGRYNVEWMGSPSNCDRGSPQFSALQRS